MKTFTHILKLGAYHIAAEADVRNLSRAACYCLLTRTIYGEVNSTHTHKMHVCVLTLFGYTVSFSLTYVITFSAIIFHCRAFVVLNVRRLFYARQRMPVSVNWMHTSLINFARIWHFSFSGRKVQLIFPFYICVCVEWLASILTLVRSIPFCKSWHSVQIANEWVLKSLTILSTITAHYCNMWRRIVATIQTDYGG